MASTAARILFDRPGWGAQLERLIESGALSFEEASQQLKLQQHDPKKKARLSSNTSLPHDVLAVAKYVGDLKNVPRTGWVHRQVPERIESVAEHSFRAGVLALLLNDDTLDISRVVSIALVHDLAESIAGDITPNEGVSDADKKVLEENAMKTIFGELVDPAAHIKIMDMWNEYEDRKTPEGKAVKDLDRFEMVIQADEYEAKFPQLDLSEFFNSVRGKFTHPSVQKWFQELEARRNKRRAAL